MCCQGFKSHKLHNALEAPGEADLTSDVDFLFLRNCLANMNGKSQDGGQLPCLTYAMGWSNERSICICMYVIDLGVGVWHEK